MPFILAIILLLSFCNTIKIEKGYVNLEVITADIS